MTSKVTKASGENNKSGPLLADTHTHYSSNNLLLSHNQYSTFNSEKFSVK